jgi:hypothetical protein
MRFIGDIHAHFGRYLELISGCDRSIQLGDFGIGFAPVPFVPDGHLFIRGNHDNPNLCKTTRHWAIDGTYYNGMFFLGGGFSTDQHKRTEGVDWWRTEELTIQELNVLIDSYLVKRPQVVVSHECPSCIVQSVLKKKYYDGMSRTAQALTAMFEIAPPKLWVFGHWHQSVDIIVGNTRFVCVDKEQFIDIPI